MLSFLFGWSTVLWFGQKNVMTCFVHFVLSFYCSLSSPRRVWLSEWWRVTWAQFPPMKDGAELDIEQASLKYRFTRSSTAVHPSNVHEWADATSSATSVARTIILIKHYLVRSDFRISMEILLIFRIWLNDYIGRNLKRNVRALIMQIIWSCQF